MFYHRLLLPSSFLIPPTGHNYSGALQLLVCELLIQPLASLPASLVMPMSPSSQMTIFYCFEIDKGAFAIKFGWKWTIIFSIYVSCNGGPPRIDRGPPSFGIWEDLFCPLSRSWTQLEVRLLRRYVIWVVLFWRLYAEVWKILNDCFCQLMSGARSCSVIF